ncbi:MAG: hypothetical protein FJ137_09960 [Deltaproteobacteria bacterium]|nr:hypothetical protein [Deltaproteobacteria bacterium]
MRTVSLAALSLAVLLALACGVPPPDRIEIAAPATLRATELGKTETLTIRAYRGVREHDYAKAPLTVTWTSSDPDVVLIDAGGVLTVTGSGKATVTASVPAGADKTLTTEVPVEHTIVSTVEMKGEFPANFKLDSPPVKVTVVVKDEKGNVVEQPKLKFRATDYCVDVGPDGLVRPLAVGTCGVVVECAGKTARIDLDVKG